MRLDRAGPDGKRERDALLTLSLTELAEYLAIAAAWVVTIIATGRRPSPFYVALAAQSFVVIGAIRLAQTGRATGHSVVVLVVGFCALAAGYSYARSSRLPGRVAVRSKSDERRPIRRSREARRGARAVFVFFALLAAYHFAVVGLPILAPNVEIARWNFTQSGLFGLPGRAYLYGLPLALVLARAARLGETESRPDWLYRAALAALVLSRVVGGFKGEVLEVVVLVYILQVGRSSSVTLAAVLRRYAVPAAVALVFAGSVSQLYLSMQSKPGTASPASQLASRMTTTAARAPLTAIEYRDGGGLLTPRVTFVHDVENYVRSITGARDTAPLFGSMLSARMYGRDVYTRGNTPGTLIVPVASGAFSVLYYNFGIGAYFAIFLIGAVFAVGEERVRRARTPLALSVSSVFLFVLYQFLMKEDFAELLVNWSAMVAVACAVYVIANKWPRVAPRPAMPTVNWSES